MAARKKIFGGEKKAAEPDQSEVRWLISYSDFMMQLVCLFILLYSVSTVDATKAQALASEYRRSRGLQPPTVQPPADTGTKAALGDDPLTGGRLGQGQVPPGVKFRVREVPEGWLVDFENPIFEPGSAALSRDVEDALAQISLLLRAYVGRVEVTGYTDADAADTLNGDALTLSQARAEQVGTYLMGRGIDPRATLVLGKGVGDVAQGRRVEILLRVK